MRIPGNNRVNDAFVLSSPHAASGGGSVPGGAAGQTPLPFEINASLDFDNIDFDFSFGTAVVARYVIPYFSSSGLRLIVAYQVVDDQSFTLQWRFGPFSMVRGEGIEFGEYRTTTMHVDGEAGDVRFVEWNITIDDKYPIGAIRDIDFILVWSNDVNGVGGIKFISLMAVSANKDRIGATVTGTPFSYVPPYFGD